METLKYFITSYLLTLIVSYSAFAQTAQFESSFIFSDYLNNSQELIIGYDPFGTDNLNPDLGEVVVPQVPSGQFGVRFQLPSDTSIYTLKDIRYGCGQPFYYEHLIDFSYIISPMEVDWEWELIYSVSFINSYNGQTLEIFNFWDSSFYQIPALDKIKIGVQYDGPLSWPEYEITSPNGGETLIGGEYYTITWWSNGIIPPSKLEYSSDAGNSWTIIIDSLFLVNNSYDWLVPNISSSQCLVRVGEYPCAYDQSNSYFTITYPVSVTNEDELPTEFSLEQNYPNPFNPTTSIQYAVNKKQLITLIVYDVLGNEVATLVNEEKSLGSYEVEFSVGQNSILSLSSGIYYYQLKAGNFIETKKMVLLK